MYIILLRVSDKFLNAWPYFESVVQWELIWRTRFWIWDSFAWDLHNMFYHQVQNGRNFCCRWIFWWFPFCVVKNKHSTRFIPLGASGIYYFIQQLRLKFVPFGIQMLFWDTKIKFSHLHCLNDQIILLLATVSCAAFCIGHIDQLSN